MRELVVVDVGGTHARFAIASISAAGAITLGPVATLRTAEHASLEDAWAAYRADQGGALPPAASIAVAATLGAPDPVIRFTNNPWELRPALLAERLGVERCLLVNDFEAVAHAVARADERDFVHLAGPDVPLGREGRISVVGPGTGLGAAHLRRSGGRVEVQATEGGHIDFAPLDTFEDALLARLRARYGRVSVERVVAGPGIADIHAVLAEAAGAAEPAADERAIWARIAEGTDPLALAAAERFCRSLGSVAGDLALAQGGFAGVVIAGGLGLRLRGLLKNSGFAERFIAKGRYESVMAAIPVKLIIHPQPGLLGAAAAFLAQAGDPQ